MVDKYIFLYDDIPSGTRISLYRESNIICIADNIILDSIQTSLITADKYRVKAKLNANVNQTSEIDLVTNKIFEAGVFSVTWERAED